VAAAIREGIKGVHIRDDVRIAKICATLTDEDGALKRPDLMYESFITKRGKAKGIYNLAEITSLWAWENKLEEAYEHKIRKYTPLQIKFRQKMSRIYDEVRLNAIVVSRSCVFLPRSQKDFAIATMLPRNRLAAHARMVVDAAITQAHEHYGIYWKALSMSERVNGAHSKYNIVEQEFAEEARDTEVFDSIRDVEVLALEDGALTNVEVRRWS
jgi:hypothetical protein